MADVKRSISLNASEPDARLRIIILQTAYLDLCNRRGWNFVETAPRAAVKHILSVIQPPELKSRLHNALKLEKNELEDDFFGFCNYLQEQSEICEQFHPLRKYRSNPKNSSDEAKRLLDAKRAGIKKEKSESKLASSGGSKDAKPSFPAKQSSSSIGGSSAKPALVLAELSGYKFACRIDSGADEVAVSDTIIQFLGDKEILLPSIHLSKAKSFKAVDGHSFKSSGMVQLCPTIKTVAGPCRLRNIKAFIMPCDDVSIMPGADCAGEIILGNPFLVHSGLDVTDFLADNIDHLSKIDYGALNTIKHPTKIGKLGVIFPII